MNDMSTRGERDQTVVPQPQESMHQDVERELQQDQAWSVDDFPGGLLSCLEALLMVSDEPLSVADIARIVQVDEPDVQTALEQLRAEYDGDGQGARMRGFTLRCMSSGWQFASRAQFEPVVSRLVQDGQVSRLSQAALEALAIVAYQQPVTRAQVAAIRGVNSDGVLRSLSVRGLIREEGVDSESRASLLVTSALFLDKLGLGSLSQLPSLAPFLPQSVADMEPEARD